MLRRFGIYLWRILAFLAAFSASVVVATLFILFLGYVGFAAEPELQNIYALGAALSFPLIALYIALYSFPVAVVAMVIAEIWALRDSLYYMACGGVIALYGITKLYDQVDNLSAASMVALLAAGILAGLSFWFFTGRRAGQWLEPREQNQP